MPRKKRAADFGWDLEEPLKRADGETLAANRALFDFFHIGTRRSIQKLLKMYREEAKPTDIVTRNESQLEYWYSQYAWLDRCAAQEMIDMRREHEVWLDRQRELREADWAMGEKLRKLALEAMDELGRGIITPRNVASVAQLATKLQRLAAGLPTDNSQVDISGRMVTLNHVTQEMYQETVIRMDYEDIRKNLNSLSILAREIASNENPSRDTRTVTVDGSIRSAEPDDNS